MENYDQQYEIQRLKTLISQELEFKESVESFRDKLIEWVELAPGEFSTLDIDREFNILSPKNRTIRTYALEGMVKMNLLERPTKRRGSYRPVRSDLIRMDYINADDEGIDIWLPFLIHKYVKILPGNIIQINGEKNSGKTALMLNIIFNNMHKQKVHYFNSEMGEGELKTRLSKQNQVSLDYWEFDAFERSGDFSDVIFPGPGHLNIVDFLECHDEFYKMGQYMRDIHDKLAGATCICCVQLNKGSDFGLGASRTEEKPRLILNVSPSKIKIKMAKNWTTDENPNGKCLDFKIVQGYQLVTNGEWYKETTT
ncbi:hypothetical protein [Pseudoalteromonas sp.]|uniref:hypothetical protein n=1 Tax=Pseudoalteromonas sp. TaxID=53249 RepID=UPI002622DB1A|nr:hypothetical protein [Pseudoalteromonas sp.]MCP4585369.1 hypothetical protein [Pseudoalteromonas sp.]